MKKLIQITLALIMALSFVGCSKDSGKTDGPVEVTLWHTYTIDFIFNIFVSIIVLFIKISKQ